MIVSRQERNEPRMFIQNTKNRVKRRQSTQAWNWVKYIHPSEAHVLVVL